MWRRRSPDPNLVNAGYLLSANRNGRLLHANGRDIVPAVQEAACPCDRLFRRFCALQVIGTSGRVLDEPFHKTRAIRAGTCVQFGTSTQKASSAAGAGAFLMKGAPLHGILST
jgi:hypothetical protein